MAIVASWFDKFIPYHVATNPRSDWPEDPAFWTAWRKAFERNGVTEEIAKDASEQVATMGIKFLADYLPAHINMCKDIRKLMPSQGKDADLSSRTAAEMGSKGCPTCQGNGLVHYRRRHSADTKDSLRRPVLAEIQCYCVCPFGRWLESSHSARSPAERARIWDLADLPFLTPGDLNHPPDPDPDRPPIPRTPAWIRHGPDRDEDVKTYWESLDFADQQRWMAEARRENPGLVRMAEDRTGELVRVKSTHVLGWIERIAMEMSCGVYEYLPHDPPGPPMVYVAAGP